MKNKKVIIIVLLSLLIIPIYHMIAIFYNRFLTSLFGLNPNNMNIGILGDSLAVLSFLALIVSLWLTGRALTKQSEELKLSREAMEQNRNVFGCHS